MNPKSLKSIFYAFLLLAGILLLFRDKSLPAAELYAQSVQPDAELPVTIFVLPQLESDGLYLGEALNFSADIGIAPLGYTFTWSFGDNMTGVVSDSSFTTHVYGSVGLKSVTLVVSNGRDTGRASEDINILVPPTPPPPPVGPIEELTVSSDAPEIAPDHFRVNEDVVITFIAGVGENQTANFSWQFGDGTVGEGATVIHSYSEPGTYFGGVSASNDSGSVAIPFQVTVLSERITGLNLITPALIHEGVETTISASVENGSNVEYRFDLGDGVIRDWDTEPVVKYTYSTYQEKIIKVKARNNATLNPVEDESCIVIRPAPIQGFNILDSSPVSNRTQPVDFVALKNSGNITTYSWEVINLIAGSSGSSSNQWRYQFTQPGIYLVVARGIGPDFNSAGCNSGTPTRYQAMATTLAVIEEIAPTSGSSLMVNGTEVDNPFNYMELLINEPYTFMIEGLQTSGMNRWDFGNGRDELVPANQPTITHAYPKAGSFVLKVTTSGTTTADAYYAIVTVWDSHIYAPTLFTNANNDALLSQGATFRSPNLLLPIPTSTNTPTAVVPTPKLTGAPTATDTPVPIAIPSETPTDVPRPTNNPTATDTPTQVPTATETTTNVPTPTSTSVPTSTLIPTSTLTPTSGTLLLPPTPIP